jgi:hypothetical protein
VRNEEQRRQRARGRPDRARSALIQEVNVIEAMKANIHAGFYEDNKRSTVVSRITLVTKPMRRHDIRVHFAIAG